MEDCKIQIQIQVGAMEEAAEREVVVNPTEAAELEMQRMKRNGVQNV